MSKVLPEGYKDNGDGTYTVPEAMARKVQNLTRRRTAISELVMALVEAQMRMSRKGENVWDEICENLGVDRMSHWILTGTTVRVNKEGP